MIYSPAEDSFLLEGVVKKISRGKRVLDVGAGSGIQSVAAQKAGAREILATDINPKAVKFCRERGIECIESDLFESVPKKKFDLIIFNPPYLPGDSREDEESALATSGGERGDEIILRFLEDVVKFLEEGGRVLILISSLTPKKRILKRIKKKRVVAERKIFMEKLEVWEILLENLKNAANK